MCCNVIQQIIMINYKKNYSICKIWITTTEKFLPTEGFLDDSSQYPSVDLFPAIEFFFFAIEKEKIYMSSGQNR